MSNDLYAFMSTLYCLCPAFVVLALKVKRFDPFIIKLIGLAMHGVERLRERLLSVSHISVSYFVHVHLHQRHHPLFNLHAVSDTVGTSLRVFISISAALRDRQENIVIKRLFRKPHLSPGSLNNYWPLFNLLSFSQTLEMTIFSPHVFYVYAVTFS